MIEFRRICERVRFGDDRNRGGAVGVDMAEWVAELEASALEVRGTIAPKIQKVVTTTCERLGIESEVRVFIRADPTPQAHVVTVDSRHPIVIVNSGLATLSEADDLAFVVGHELGHLGLMHQAEEQDEESEVRKYAALWRRRAGEISADRIGLLACQSSISATKAILKVASGLPIHALQVDVGGYLAQVTQDRAAAHARATHPGLPTRLAALLKFYRSEECQRFIGAGTSGESLTSVDSHVRELLNAAGDHLLVRMYEERLQRVRGWAAGVVAELHPQGLDAALGAMASGLTEQMSRNVASALRTSREPIARGRFAMELQSLSECPQFDPLQVRQACAQLLSLSEVPQARAVLEELLQAVLRAHAARDAR